MSIKANTIRLRVCVMLLHIATETTAVDKKIVMKSVNLAVHRVVATVARVAKEERVGKEDSDITVVALVLVSMMMIFMVRVISMVLVISMVVTMVGLVRCMDASVSWRVVTVVVV